ncbi:MAG TPA: SUMF1/EgtB/PvdO family nonheme iron enzyme [Kofleriaceae bacterium]|nr:SUMF1/EgtB/PvdO family nonheme iron enzyme [Kofleriaceae bacterium]
MARVLCLAAAVAAIAGTSHADQRAKGRVVRVAQTRGVEVRVPAGRFWMGVDEDTAGAALAQCEMVFPAMRGTSGGRGAAAVRVDFCMDYFDTLTAMKPREVFVDAFYIDRDEVTVDDYRRCVAAGACDLDALIAGDERYIKDGWPMVNATWYEAQSYCRWRDARLPTEAEWERAARGDDPSMTWPWGELEQPADFNHGQARNQAMREIDRQPQTVPLQFFGDPDDSDGHAIMAPPGSYVWGQGPYGTRDQAGNVAEWTADAWVFDQRSKGYENLDANNPYREGTHTDPRVVRGGSWRQPTFVAKSNLRDPFNKEYMPNQRFSHVGFRCARSAR